MGLPRQLPSGDSGSGHGPFGDKAFKRALIGCLVLVIVGPPLIVLGGAAPRTLGTSFLVLGALGLIVGGAGLLTERLLQRRPPPPDVRGGNGRGAYRPDRSRIERPRRRT